MQGRVSRTQASCVLPGASDGPLCNRNLGFWIHPSGLLRSYADKHILFSVLHPYPSSLVISKTKEVTLNSAHLQQGWEGKRKAITGGRDDLTTQTKERLGSNLPCHESKGKKLITSRKLRPGPYCFMKNSTADTGSLTRRD